MRFDLSGVDSKYSDAMMNFIFSQLGDEMKEERKQAQYKKNLEALKSGGLGGDIYPKGISGEGQPEYGIRSPKEKMELAEQMQGFQRQQDIGKMMKSQAFLKQPAQPVSNVNLLGMAKTGQKPEAKLMTTTGQRLLARQAVKETPPELLGKRFLLSPKGYTETASKLPKDINFDVGLTDKVINQLGTNRSEAELFVKNISKFKEAGVDINKVMNALYKTATPEEKESWMKKLMGMFTQ